MFNHVNVDLPTKLNRVSIDGKRYYEVQDQKLVSVTTVTSFQSAKSIAAWRARVGEEAANRKTRRATSRGTDMHTLTEHYLKNEPLPKVQPLSEFLFKFAKSTLDNIDNIHALETSEQQVKCWGIPPFFTHGIGYNPHQYFLPDSGATKWMTPFYNDF